MRSSIACIRCRRSKIKCVNNGVGTRCRACETSNRDCQYPPPIAAGGVRPRESFSNDYGTGEGRPKAKKRAQPSTSSGKDDVRPLFDALDPRLLTVSIWQELYDLFQIHYSADLPFLHVATFLKPLRQAAAQQQAADPSSPEASILLRPPMCPEFLLAFLALTARFHPKLVAHHSPATLNRTSNPLIASEYYASAATERLSGLWTNDGSNQDIERIQALLMLGLHEWGMCRGSKAWLTIGIAIRSAQALGLQYELDLDDEPLSRAVPLDPETDMDTQKTAAQTSDDFIHQEIRRRTFWSCYIMDRYLSSGKYRPQMLHAREIRIQLPASERTFAFGDHVRTLMLGEEEEGVAGRAEVESMRRASVLLCTGGRSTPEAGMDLSPRTKAVDVVEDDDSARLESGEDEGLVSRYVKVLEIYGKIMKWSCGGGRRTERYPPWDTRSEFYHLRKQCVAFKASLPRQHALTRQNTQAHISMKTSTPYMLVHTVYLLCLVMLHREYVPFVPIRCSKPEGPLDPPLFPADRYDVPSGFWEDSARECFKSAREIMDLVRNCQEWSALVETPIVGFAIYTVAFIGVYCINFPWMDLDGYMCTRYVPDSDAAHLTETKPGESKGFEAARKALEMIGQMRKKLNMADGWFKTINRMHKYFRRIKSDYRKNVAATGEGASENENSPHLTRHVSLREGGQGGGLEEFRLIERVLKEFGNLEDHEIELAMQRRPTLRPYDAVLDDSRSGTSVKTEEPDYKAPVLADPPRSDTGPWNAINAPPPTSNNGQFRSFDYYTQAIQPSQAQAQPRPDATSGESHPIPVFRPVFTQNQSIAPAPDPGLTSPTSQSMPTPSQPSPHFDSVGQQQRFSNPWPSQVAMQPPSAAPYANSLPYASPGQQTTPIQAAAAAYPTPAVQPQPWSAMEKEAWLNALNTPLGGDDFVAFADGGDMAEWAMMSANRGYGGGWLSAVWGDSAVS